MSISVLVVDDSVLFRTKLQLSLNEDPEIEVIACVSDATMASKLIEQRRPDVITLDVEMPKINGIDFLRQLIPNNPIPVVVVSSLPIHALDALNAGAVDFVRKPASNHPNALNNFIKELKSKISVASTAKVRKPIASTSRIVPKLSTNSINNSNLLIAIGASTGGTEAILQVVKDLPTSTPGIVIVQHMPPNFTNLYAQRLHKLCAMDVKEAVDYDLVVPGKIIIAAGDKHLVVKKDSGGYYVRCMPGERVSGHCPSVDVMFDSVAQVAGQNAIGIILTGMGADGAAGLSKMRARGAYTIGQDKDTCVVYGMPMEAHKLGAVTRQFPLQLIGSELLYQVKRNKRRS